MLIVMMRVLREPLGESCWLSVSFIQSFKKMSKEHASVRGLHCLVIWRKAFIIETEQIKHDDETEADCV